MRLYLPGGLLKRAEADVSDLTDSTRSGACYWDPAELDVLVCPFDPEPTEAESVAIRRRVVTVDAADEQRLYDLLAMVPASPFESAWLASELARYGETPPTEGA